MKIFQVWSSFLKSFGLAIKKTIANVNVYLDSRIGAGWKSIVKKFLPLKSDPVGLLALAGFIAMLAYLIFQ